MLIKNRKEIATTDLRKKALDIIEEGIKRVLPLSLIKSTVKYNPSLKILNICNIRYDLSQGRIFVIGGGKASGSMAEALERIIGPENITDGVVNCVDNNYKTTKIKIIKAGHPIPDKRGIKGVKEMLGLKEKYSINKNDLIIGLISGGGSALMSYPVEGITLKDKQELTKLLLTVGAEIGEINILRKHLSKIKGGKLGSFFSPTPVVSLIISDVVGNRLDFIASGPTVSNSSTFSDAYNILEKYNLVNKAPKRIVDFLKKKRNLKERPKRLDNCKNLIIGDNKMALKAMAEKAKAMGFNPCIITSTQTGDPNLVSYKRAREIIKGKYGNCNVILIGGETTPKLPKNYGKGGRNQHYAAVSLLSMERYPGRWTLVAFSTDGSDFLPNVAGAIVDNNSLISARKKGIDIQAYVNKYDSNTLLKKIGNSLIITGPTGTNVCDIILYILRR